MARPRQPRTDRTTAVRTALEMIDEDGLAAFSIERLGRRLGVKGPSLYHHFTDRADLLARVAQLVLLEVPDPLRDPEDAQTPWDERMLEITVEFRRAMMRHPHAIPVVLEHFPRGLLLRAYEAMAVALEAAQVPPEHHLLVFEGLEKLTLGSAAYWAAPEAAGDPDHRHPFASLAIEDYPAVGRAVAASPHIDDEALFEAACVAFITGVKARVATPA
jgi:AcrR family transcriptional regulator